MTLQELGIGASKNTGVEYTLCPKCSHKRKPQNQKKPCLKVRHENGTGTCLHCEAWYTLDLGWFGETNYSRPTREFRVPQYVVKSGLPAEVVQHFAERGIGEEVLVKNSIGFENGWIEFPFFEREHVVNCKYRKLAEKEFRLEKDAKLIAYGIDSLQHEILVDESGDRYIPWVVIVEGEYDKLACEQAGISPTISVPNGSQISERGMEWIDHANNVLKLVREVYIAVDSDAKGRALEEALTQRFGAERVWIVSWPNGCKDANDTLVQCGAERVREAILSDAKRCPINGIFELRDFEDKLDRKYEGEIKRKGFSTGWLSLDDYYMPLPGQFSVLTGIPNSGKSEWLDELLVNQAKKYGKVTAYVSPENMPMEDHAEKLIEKFVGKPFRQGPTPRMSREEYRNAKEFIHEHFKWIYPNEDQFTVDGILALYKQAVLRWNAYNIITDPWNELDHSRPNGLSESEYISRSLGKMRRFARERELHLTIVAHPTKLHQVETNKVDEEGAKITKFRAPNPYDISGSAHWRNKADNCLTVHRDLSNPDSPIVEVHIQKVRSKHNGRVGMVELYYDLVTGCYFETEFELQAKRNARLQAEQGFDRPLNIVMPRYGGVEQESF